MKWKGTFTYQTVLMQPLDQVWDFFQSAENLVTITSFPKMTVKGPSGAAVGKTIQLELNFGLWKIPWESYISEWKEQEGFEDILIYHIFPFHSWKHRHQFASKSVRETIMTDRVEFESSLPPWLIKAGLVFMFKDRERMIKKHFGRRTEFLQ